MQRTSWIALLACVASACGGSSPRATNASSSDEPRQETSRTDIAIAALLRGDFGAARRTALDALRIDADDERAMEVVGHASLALGQTESAIGAMEPGATPMVASLRARLRVMQGDFAGAAADVQLAAEADPPDPWARAMLPIVRSARGHEAYRFEGAAQAQVAFVEGTPLPIIDLVIGERHVDALVATSASFVVLDEAATEGPWLDRMAFGELIIRDVPVWKRPLTQIADQIGRPIGAVVGLDVLLRARATVDGRAKALIVRGPRAVLSPVGASSPFATFDGSFLAVPALVSENAGGWFVIDSAGGFPVALGSDAFETLHLDPESLRELPNGPPDARVTELPAVRVGSASFESVPAIVGILPPDLSRTAGGPVAGMFGWQLLSQLRVTIDAEARRIWIE